MARKYKLRQGEVGGEEYKPRRRNKKIQICEEGVKEVISSTLSAAPPSMITSTPDVVMVEMSGTQGATTEVEKSVEEVEEEVPEVEEAPTVENTQMVESTQIVESTQKGEEGETGMSEEEEKEEIDQEIDLISSSEIVENEGRKKTRSFLVTINKGNKKMVNVLKREGLESDFIIIGGEERGEKTGHEHYHAVIHYKCQRSTQNLIKKIKGYGQVLPIVNYKTGVADTESLIRTVRYIQKVYQIIYQSGKLPEQGRRNDLKGMLRECKSSDEFRKKYEDVWIRYRNGIKDYYEEEKSSANFSSVYDDVRERRIHKASVKIIFITGFSGSGKSSFAWEIAVNYLKIPREQLGTIKYTGNGTFNNGYNCSAPYLIWNEFRDNQITHDEFYHLCDKYGNDCNIKYGKYYLRPKLIIIDSIQALEKIFPEEEDRKRYQIYRRIYKYLEMEEDFSVREIDLQPLLEKTKDDPTDEELLAKRKEFEELQKQRSYKPFDPTSLIAEFNLNEKNVTPIPKLNVRHKAKPNALDDDDIAIILSKMDDDVDELQNEHNEHISDSK